MINAILFQLRTRRDRLLGRHFFDGFTRVGPVTGGPTIEPHFADPILRNRSQGVFIDVGANTGGWSLVASKYYTKIYAFEPSPKTLERLRINVALNKIQNIHIFGCALGKTDEFRDIFVSDNDPGRNSFYQNHADRFTTGQARVHIKTLDSFDLKPDVIKIDTEGYEEQVLEGGLETIAVYRPRLVIETHIAGEAKRIMALLPTYKWHSVWKTGQIFLISDEG